MQKYTLGCTCAHTASCPSARPETVSGQFAESFSWPRWQQAADGERRHRLCQTVQSLHVHQLGGSFNHLPPRPVHRHGSKGDHYTLAICQCAMNWRL